MAHLAAGTVFSGWRSAASLIRRLQLAWAFAALLLVACGDNGDDEDAQPTPATRTALLSAVTEMPTGALPTDAATPGATPEATPVEIEDPPATP